MPLGQLLGCGHWGCVFESTSPWVVKFTRDPTEGPIWAKLRAWEAETDYATDGIVRIKDIVRLYPDIKFGRREWPIHAIVREEVAPVFSSEGTWTPYTAERLGSSQFPRCPTLPPLQKSLRSEFLQTLQGLQLFRDHAASWHRVKAYKRPEPRKLEYFEELMTRATNYMTGPIGGRLGETLNQLVVDGIVLRDVHHGNIGWRVKDPSASDDDTEHCIVIFDPGHTPTDDALPIRELTPNR